VQLGDTCGISTVKLSLPQLEERLSSGSGSLLSLKRLGIDKFNGHGLRLGGGCSR
jgi:hypothetical protein